MLTVPKSEMKSRPAKSGYLRNSFKENMGKKNWRQLKHLGYNHKDNIFLNIVLRITRKTCYDI